MLPTGEPQDYAQLRWDADGQPHSCYYDDLYFSRHDGLGESRRVFLAQNQLTQRWQPETLVQLSRPAFVIGETGFGSGLNFLTAWQLWEQCAVTSHQLHFISVEKHPMHGDDLAKALSQFAELEPYRQQLLNHYATLATPGFRHFQFGPQVSLTLIIDDAVDGLRQLVTEDQSGGLFNGVDAWFLDGFAPAKNPAMWSPALFQLLAQLSHADAAQPTTLGTFTVAGTVRRGLEQAGFAVTKQPGTGDKREILQGVFQGRFCHGPQPAFSSMDTHNKPPSMDTYKKPPRPWTQTTSSFHGHTPQAPERPALQTPWFALPSPPSSRQVCILGAGLAGCQSAAALARLGWQVTLIDRAQAVASGASGNPQGVVYGKLSKDNDSLAQFNLASVLHAQSFYQRFWQAADGPLGQACGVMQLAHDDKQQRIYQQLLAHFGDASDSVQFLDAARASEIAGITLDHPAVYFPRLGWLDPAALCRALTHHPAIHWRGGQAVADIEQDDQQHWLLRDARGQVLHRTPCLVLTNAWEATQFTPTAQLPIKPIRGQITQLPADAELPPLRTALCATGYLAPANRAGEQTLGATFDLHSDNTAVTASDHRANLAAACRAFPSLATHLNRLDPTQLEGRTAFRCATRDYLPIVGPAPDHDAYLTDFAALRKDATTIIGRQARYWPNLYLNLGHGSRGLAYTPLAAALLAAQLSGTPWPVGQKLGHALHPGRFIIRDLMRNRV